MSNNQQGPNFISSKMHKKISYFIIFYYFLFLIRDKRIFVLFCIFLRLCYRLK